MFVDYQASGDSDT